MWWHGDWTWWFLSVVVMLAFWGLVGWAMMTLAGEPRDRRKPDAEALLAERFARGDINEDEYRRRLAVLQAGAPRRSADV